MTSVVRKFFDAAVVVTMLALGTHIIQDNKNLLLRSTLLLPIYQFGNYPIVLLVVCSNAFAVYLTPRLI